MKDRQWEWLTITYSDDDFNIIISTHCQLVYSIPSEITTSAIMKAYTGGVRYDVKAIDRRCLWKHKFSFSGILFILTSCE